MADIHPRGHEVVIQQDDSNANDDDDKHDYCDLEKKSGGVCGKKFNTKHQLFLHMRHTKLHDEQYISVARFVKTNQWCFCKKHHEVKASGSQPCAKCPYKRAVSQHRQIPLPQKPAATSIHRVPSLC